MISFEKPLIVGASISADWAAHSPGKRLSHRYTKPSDVRVIARGGQPGWKMLESVSTEVLKDRTVVIGFDLFFWDTSRQHVQPSIDALKKLIAETKALGLPLIIGDIPELLPGFQPGRKELNQMIRRAGLANDHVYVIPLEDLYLKILKDHSLEIGDKRYSFFDLVPDGLHIGETASDFLADLILETVEKKSAQRTDSSKGALA